MHRLIEVEQRAPQWYVERATRITSSEVHRAIAMHKAYARDLKNALNGIMPDYVNAPSLQWGREAEPMAAAAYEMRTGQETETTGFYVHRDYDFIGGSPDPLVGTDGSTEIKCPYNPDNHIIALVNNEIPEKHIPQIQTNLMLTERKWCDFISFDPRQPFPRDLFIKRVYPDPEYHKFIINRCVTFWNDYVLCNNTDFDDISIGNIPDLF
jgi:predicted phage-related endonuclease